MVNSSFICKMWVIVIFLTLFCNVISLNIQVGRPKLTTRVGIQLQTPTTLMAKKSSESAASRRRKRRISDSSQQIKSRNLLSGGSDVSKIAESIEKRDVEPLIVNQPSSSALPASKVKDPAIVYAQRAAYGSVPSDAVKEDGTSSIEDMFGLGNDQLRELMETELPVPREDLITKKAIEEKDQDQDKVFALPDLNEFLDSTQKEKTQEELDAEAERDALRIDRSNQEEYIRVMQLNPFADADDTMFTEEYDIFPSIFGSGKLLGIPVPYLQTGHGILLIICVLAGFVYAPGNPLTEFPVEIRNFLKEGLSAVYSINLVLAVQAFFVARSKSLPGAFWAAKTLILGGIAFYEIKKAQDPTKPAVPESKSYKSDRKSQNRDQTKFQR